jgi:predicted cupin superfamily sugar epimerase
VVKGGTLKSVRLEAGAEFGLLGEGVAPGFDFRDFKWVTAKELKALSPEAFAKTSDLIKPQPEETFDHFYEK